MPKPTDYDKTHRRNMAAIGTRIDRIFKKATEEAAKIGVSIKAVLPDDRIFSFADFPETQKQIERLLAALKQSMETAIVNGVRSSWTLSNNKNNALVSRIFGDRVGSLSKEQYRRYFSTNADALEAFLQRRERGLNLSDRVWRYTNEFKREIELGLDLGIRTGESAAEMTRSLRQYLQHPDKLFRRVRDKHGNLKLSKAAKAFHPGRGVYRSSYKNARRLAATETNIAYRTSDHLRWQQMEFVVGIEIKLSNNHMLNGVPLTDICDTLKGKYPKDFKFVGWHPHCRCHAVTVLKTEDEMAEDTRRILDGKEPTKTSRNTVRDVPDAFKGWVEEHSERIEMGGNLPYFLQDNRQRVNRILGLVEDTPKTALDIAAERHANRTPEQAAAIQQRWNEARIAGIESYIQQGYLPKEVAENLQELAAKDLDAFNDRIKFLQQRAARHASRTPADRAAIQQRWDEKLKRDAKTRRDADRVLALAKTWNEVDYSALADIIAKNNLTAMPDETRKLMDALKVMRAQEKALEDIIPNAHEWHKTFTLKELQDTRASIIGKLSKWEAQGMSLATDSDLAQLKKKLEFEIGYVENPGKYKPGVKPHAGWQVAQAAYKQQLQLVETRIEIIPLEKTWNDLQGFSTTSKEFKDYMAKAKAALDAGDPTAAQHYLSNAQWKKDSLEARRKGKSSAGAGKPGGVKFAETEFTQTKKDNSLWFGGNLSYDRRQIGWNEADKYMHPLARQNWLGWDANQREVGYLYTSGSRYINEPLFAKYYGTKTGLDGTARNCWRDINTLTDMIDRAVPLPNGMWVQHGEDMGAFMARFGFDLNEGITEAIADYTSKLKAKYARKYRRMTPKLRKEMEDKIARYREWRTNRLNGHSAANKPFTSCGCSKYSGFADYEVVMNIYCPAGTKGIYAEPFSYFGDGTYGRSAYNWKGQSRQAEGYNSSYENEIILQRGSVFRITKIEFNEAEGKWYVDCELIEQPKKLANII